MYEENNQENKYIYELLFIKVKKIYINMHDVENKWCEN